MLFRAFPHVLSHFILLAVFRAIFPGGAKGKEPAWECRRLRRRFNPWVGKILWRRAWQSIPVFLPGESLGQGMGPPWVNPWRWRWQWDRPRPKGQGAGSVPLLPGQAFLVIHTKNKSLDLTQPRCSSALGARMAVPPTRDRVEKATPFWQMTIVMARDLHFLCFL